MKEARQSGELEAALAATSVFPVPKRASRATVPLADYNMMKAAMAKPMHVQVEQVTPNTVTITPKAQPKMHDVGPYSVDNSQLVKGLEALESFESVPRRWPLARLTVPLLKCVEYLERVLAGCCWEVLITRKDPDDSLGALRQAAKSFTLTLTGYLADFVAETLRASRTLQGGPLTDEENIHLWEQIWVQPICQELLHAASGHKPGVPRLGLWTQRVLLIGLEVTVQLTP